MREPGVEWNSLRCRGSVPCACCLGWCSLSNRPNRLLEPLGSGTILTAGVLRHGLRSACRERLTLAGTFH